MYYARAYRLAADRIGMSDYRASAQDKLRTASVLDQFIVGEFHYGSALALEAMLVLIMIIDLVYLFRKQG